MARKGQVQAVTGFPEAAFAHLHSVFAASCRPDQALPAVLTQHPRVLLGATERPMPRSTDTEAHRQHYPGKKGTP